MDTPKLRKLISAMYLDIIVGDVHVRNQYMNTLLTHIAVLLRMEKLEPPQPATVRFRTRLHDTIQMILNNNHPLPPADTERDIEIKEIMKYFDRFVIQITPEVADDEGLDQVTVLENIETLEYCRNMCYSAAEDYSNALSGVPEGLTKASNKFAYIINLVTPILYQNQMIDISEVDFKNAASAAVKRNEPIPASKGGERK